ncbi:hypothetical protein JCM15765_09190 [Paradesulfitobacterium aromaticivorans]
MKRSLRYLPRLLFVILVGVSLLLAGCDSGENDNNKPPSECDKTGGRTFAVSDTLPDGSGNGNGESGSNKDVLIKDKYVSQEFTVYIYVSNNGEKVKDNEAKDVKVSLINADTEATIRTFGSFDIPEGGNHALSVTYDKPARVYFHVEGEIRKGGSDNDKDENGNNKNSGDGGKGNESEKHWESICGNSNVFNIAVIANKLKLEGFKDFALDQALDASDPNATEPKWKAGHGFYIKITAQKPDDTTDTSFSFDDLPAGWKIVALDPSGNPYPETVFAVIGEPQQVSPGIGRINAEFNDVGIIKLRVDGIEGVESDSKSVGRFIPDHFELTAGPVLKVRGDIGSEYDSLPDAERFWGYIGEPVDLQLTVKAVSANGRTTENYIGDFAKFNSVLGSASNPGWGLKLSSDAGDTTGRLQLSPGVGAFNEGVASLTATVKVGKASNSQETLTGLSLSVQPTDPDGVTLNAAAPALIIGRNNSLSGPFSLYGGRIHVIGGYYTEPTVTVPLYVERWDNGQFIKNTLDSQTSIPQGGLTESGGPPNVLSISNKLLEFRDGEEGLPITNNGGSNITRTLAPLAIPSYFDFYSENLAWGQILQPGGSPGNSDIIWEKEEP